MVWLPVIRSNQVDGGAENGGSLVWTQTKLSDDQLGEDQSIVDQWERQLNEIEAMEAIYAEPLPSLLIDSTNNRRRIRSNHDSLKDVFQSMDVILIDPPSLHVELQDLIKRRCRNLNKVKALHDKYRCSPLNILIFLKECVYLTTHVGFHFTLSPNYPVSRWVSNKKIINWSGTKQRHKSSSGDCLSIWSFIHLSWNPRY